MKKLFILVLALIAMASCREKTREDFVKDEFKEYVKTDFDDPADFEEITSVEPIDTVDSKEMLEMIDKFKEISYILPDYDNQRFNDFEEKFKKDKTVIITYELKVRVKKAGRKSVKVYYVIDDGSEMKVQDHQMLIDEMPELYKEFCQYSGAMLQ